MMNSPIAFESTAVETGASLQQDAARRLITDMQSQGLRLLDVTDGVPSRRGGAGPSDHKAVIVDGHTVMIPVHTNMAMVSPFSVGATGADGRATVMREGNAVAQISFPKTPRFYDLHTEDGIPYWKIAQLHGSDVLATTVLQTCVRFGRRSTSCQFCAIGDSLAADRTINRKLPHHLAEVARAAVELDGVKHMVMTTGTPNFTDRGAAILCDSATSVKIALDLPIQAQCEPPDDSAWFARLKEAGVDTLGMHLEAVTPDVRARIMPGKAEVTIEQYLRAFADAVDVFGRGQVSTYIIAGLGDTSAAIIAMCRQLVQLGVYPFVVPFVPISSTPLRDHPAPDAAFMREILQPLGEMLTTADMRSRDIKAGCGRCGACSTLARYES
jgi:radical SAM protein (TIGR04043 family)